MIHHDTPQHEPEKPNYLVRLLVLLAVLMPLAAAGFTAYPSNDGQRRADTNAARSVDPHKVQQGIPPKPSESPNDTPYYNEPTPASKLTDLYTDALSEAVKDKDTKACQAGLENFRKELSKAPMAVIRDIDAANAERNWQVPTYDSFLDTVHTTYACQQATKLDLMSDLAPDTRARNALAIMDSKVVWGISQGSQACVDLLSKDYRYYVQSTSAAGKVMLSLLTLTLPEELTNKQFKMLCEDTDNQNSYQQTA